MGQNKLAVLRSWGVTIWKDIWKKHADLSSEDPKQICKSILKDFINDNPETSMHKCKDLNSDGMDELQNPPSMYRKKT